MKLIPSKISSLWRSSSTPKDPAKMVETKQSEIQDAYLTQPAQDEVEPEARVATLQTMLTQAHGRQTQADINTEQRAKMHGIMEKYLMSQSQEETYGFYLIP